MVLGTELRRISRLGQLVIIVFFGGAALWLAFAPLQGAVVASGVVKVENYRKTIQLNEGGIIKRILVREGERVAQGDSLLELEDSEAAAAYGVLRGTLDALLARKSRLESEAIGSAKLTISPELLERQNIPSVAEQIQRERKLFLAKREILNGQIASLGKQVLELSKEHEALSAQVRAERGSETLAKEELSAYYKLRDKNFISEPKLLEQKRKVLEYQSRSEEHLAEVSRSLRLKEELNLKTLTLRSDYARAANDELKEVTARIAEISDRLRPAEEVLKRRIVKAPVSGTVLALKTHTVGAAVAPRDPLMEIVPDNSALLIEAQVGIDAIKELHLDQNAEIRFPALPYRTTPLIDGKVIYIAADVQLSKDGQPYYLVQVNPLQDSMQAAQLPPLQPGMAAEVFIQTKARTALEYFIKPIYDTLGRSFRER